MPYKRRCKICKNDYGNGIMMVKLTDSWICTECLGSLLRKRYG